MISASQKLGEMLLSLPLFLGRVFFLLLDSFRDLYRIFTQRYSWGVGREVLRLSLLQIWFTGIEILALVILIGLIFSGSLLFLGYENLRQIGAEGLFDEFLRFGIVLEVGPLLIALMIIARSGTAITADIASQVIRGDIDVMKVHGMSIPLLIVLPRLIGVCIATMMLSLFFILIIYGGMFVWAPLVSLDFEEVAVNIFGSLQRNELGIVLLKGIIFGFTAAVIACYKGLYVKRDIRDLPRVSSQTVVFSISTIFVLDGILAGVVWL